MTVDAKAIIKAFYGTGPARSSWVGCSLGGLEGLIEARCYPTDHDGIVMGAPPNPLISFNAAQLWPSWPVSQNSALQTAMTDSSPGCAAASVISSGRPIFVSPPTPAGSSIASP